MIWIFDKNAVVKLTANARNSLLSKSEHVLILQVGLAIALALATVVVVDLVIVHRTQTAQVVEGIASTASTADDVINVGSITPSWDCADVPITLQCSRTQAHPGMSPPAYPEGRGRKTLQ
jgi:hypothetical protein